MIPSTTDLPKVAKALLPYIQELRKVALHGEMGAGKTTLVTAIGQELRVKDTVSSPTFTLVNEYALTENDFCYHIDAYRLKSLEEALDIGLEDYLFDDSICFLEWPEKVKPLLPEQMLHLHLRLLDDGVRELKILNADSLSAFRERGF